MFSVAALLSSHLLYNTASLIHQADVEHLDVLARRAKMFQLRLATSRLGDGRHVRLRSIANVASRQDISSRLDAFRSRARSRPARRVGALRR